MKLNSNPEAFLTLDELISIRGALLKCESTLSRLVLQDKELKEFYKKDLESIKEAKQTISNSINREII